LYSMHCLPFITSPVFIFQPMRKSSHLNIQDNFLWHYLH
jgi:hypothetical protein